MRCRPTVSEPEVSPHLGISAMYILLLIRNNGWPNPLKTDHRSYLKCIYLRCCTHLHIVHLCYYATYFVTIQPQIVFYSSVTVISHQTSLLRVVICTSPSVSIFSTWSCCWLFAAVIKTLTLTPLRNHKSDLFDLFFNFCIWLRWVKNPVSLPHIITSFLTPCVLYVPSSRFFLHFVFF